MPSVFIALCRAKQTLPVLPPLPPKRRYLKKVMVLELHKEDIAFVPFCPQLARCRAYDGRIPIPLPTAN